jgi:hypothetical protein
MSVLFKRASALDRRLKRLETEISDLERERRTRIQQAEAAVAVAEPVEQTAPPRDEAVVPAPPIKEPASDALSAAGGLETSHEYGATVASWEAGRNVSEPRPLKSLNEHDTRLVEYLSASFETARPLRVERHIQRNKAIAMSVVALIVLFWVLWRFVL